MVSIAEIAQTMDSVVTESASALARSSGFVQRASKLTGPLFAKTLVLGWLGNPDASLSELCQVAGSLGLSISPQGLEERFDKGAVAFLEQLLATAVGKLIAADPVAIPILRRFSAVILEDSTVIGLPDALVGVLARHWGTDWSQPVGAQAPGSARTPGRRAQRSAPPGRPCPRQDLAAPGQRLPEGCLHLADLGFFVLEQLGEEDAAKVYWLRRLPVSVAVFDVRAIRTGVRWELWQLLEAKKAQGWLDRLDLEVRLGVEKRSLRSAPGSPGAPGGGRGEAAEAPRRGQAQGPDGQSGAAEALRLDGAGHQLPPELLSIEEALVLARVRWQIELLFKLWKSEGLLDQSRSKQPLRILAEVYAKLWGS